MFRAGQYLTQPRFPARLGYEAAGTLAAIGDGVTGFKVGDAVSVIPGFDMSDYGLYGDLANAPAAMVAHYPPSLSWGKAGAVWMQYLTASGALIDIAGLTAGDAAVSPAASSSVGLATAAAPELSSTRSAGRRSSSSRRRWPLRHPLHLPRSAPSRPPLPLFNTLAKSLTIRGYLLFEITANPAWLERPASFPRLGALAAAGGSARGHPV
jgi:Alcohol dehydrogenase GroES-like domain